MYLVLVCEGDKSLLQGIPLHSQTTITLTLIVICHLAIETIDYILTICKVINNNKTVMIQLLARYFIDFCDKILSCTFRNLKNLKNELLGALVNKIFFSVKAMNGSLSFGCSKKSWTSVVFHKEKFLSFEAIYCSVAWCMQFFTNFFFWNKLEGKIHLLYTHRNFKV